MNLFKLVGSIFVDNEKANDSISKTDTKAGNLAKKFAEGVVSAAKWGAGVTTAAVGMATAAGAAIVKIADETREYRKEMGKLETAFEDSNHSAKTAEKTYRSLQSILGETDQSVEAANHLAKLCNTEAELAEWTQICTGVYASFGASLPIEGLAEAANETAKTGSLTGSLADALNWAGVNEEKFQEKLDKCSSEQERQKLITETLTKLYSDVAEKYRENNKEVIKANEAQERWNATLAKVGEKVEPVVTGFKEFGATLLESALPALDAMTEEGGLVTTTMDFLKATIVILTQVISTIIGAINGSNEAWENSVKWAKENKTMLGLLTIAFNTLTSAILAYNSSKIAKAVIDKAETAYIYMMIAAENAHTIATTIATGATTAFGAAVAFLTSPITLAVAAIGGLIEIGVLLYQNWDTVKEKAEELWTSITETFENIKNDVTEKIESIKERLSNKMNEMKKDAENILQLANETVDEKLQHIQNAYDRHGGGVRGIVAATMEGIRGYYTAGYTFIDKLTNGKLSDIASTFENKMDSARQKVSNKLGEIQEKFSDTIDKARTTVKNGVEKIKDLFDFEWSLPKLKLPHFKITGKFNFDSDSVSVPKVSVSWYDKAVKNPVILNKPTLFGYSETSGKFLGGGETKDEVLAGKDTLMEMIKSAASEGQNEYLIQILDVLMGIFAWLSEGEFEDMLIDIITEKLKIKWSDREIARLVKKYA